MLEMIQQKVDASQVRDRRSHSLQQSRRRSEVLKENPQEKTNVLQQNLDAYVGTPA